MKSLNLAEHIVNSIYIIRTNTIILWFLGLIGITSCINGLYPDNMLHNVFMFIFIAAAVFATPVIYGIYYEIIEDNYSSIGEIAKKYLLPYLWLLFRLYSPVVFFAMVPLMSDPTSVPAGYFQMTVITCSLLFIYIIPTFYVSGNQKGSVLAGIQFLFKNISASAPLILVSLFAESMILLFEMKKQWLLDLNKFSYVIGEFLVYMTANIIDFILFITMVFVLKEYKNMKAGEQGSEH